MLREEVDSAIRRWTLLGLFQKELARRVNVADTTLSHILNDHYYTISDDLSRRIIRTVHEEEATRIANMPMEVVAFCHGSNFVETPEVRTMVLSNIRNALSKGTFCSEDCDLPKDIGGVLLRLGGPKSPFFLITLNAANSDEEKVALAHELGHIQRLILAGVSIPFRPPRSSF